MNRHDYKKLVAPPRPRNGEWTAADEEAYLDWLGDAFDLDDELDAEEIGITARPKQAADIPYRDPECEE